jgi:hypothetical protein
MSTYRLLLQIGIVWGDLVQHDVNEHINSTVRLPIEEFLLHNSASSFHQIVIRSWAIIPVITLNVHIARDVAADTSECCPFNSALRWIVGDEVCSEGGKTLIAGQHSIDDELVIFSENLGRV